MKKTIFLVLTLHIYVTCLSQAPTIHSEIYQPDNSGYGLSFTTRNLLDFFGVPLLNAGSYGVIDLYDGSDNRIHSHTLTPTTSMSFYQAQQQFDNGNWAMASIYIDENEITTEHSLYDSSLNTIVNLYELGARPDIHGIGWVDDNKYIYFENVYDTINFYNPPAITDASDWQTLGHNIVIIDLDDTSKTTIFDWFATIPKTMIVPEYFREGDIGSNTIDWGHPNWIEKDFDGGFLVSWRHLGMMKIDVEGNVQWFGGLPSGMAAAHGFSELTGIRTRLQHNLKPYPNKPNHYSVFDNGDLDRDSSRALFFSVDALSATVEKEKWYPYSPFMGSVDVNRYNESWSVNIPLIDSSLTMSTIASWIPGNALDSISPFMDNMGSHIYNYTNDGNLMSHYWTDSMTYIYSTQLVKIANPVVTDVNSSGSLSTLTVKAYPNPTDNLLHIESNHEVKYADVYDINGRLLLSKKLHRSNTILDVKQFKSGTYFVHLFGDFEMERLRFVKE